MKLPFEDIPDDVCTLINHLCDLAVAPYQVVAPPFLPPPPNSKLSFFANLLQIRGPHCYSVDQLSSSKHRINQENEDACRKYSSTHPTLTPGIFTIYCEHGICCGFEVIQSHESPKRPFNISHHICRATSYMYHHLWQSRVENVHHSGSRLLKKNALEVGCYSYIFSNF